MDNFMDKLAQRFNAQEIIRANSQAEAQELERLRQQIKAYDECLQEMRKLNLKNTEAAEGVRILAEQANTLLEQASAAADKNADAQEAEKTQIKEMTDEVRKLLEENAAQALQTQEKLTAVQGALEEFMHKESVKVYRNVQAVLQDELKGQTKEIGELFARSKKGGVWLYVLAALTLLASLGSVAILAAGIFGIL